MNLAFIKKNFKGYGEMIAACILWGLAGVFGKMVIGMTAQSIIFYRVLIAFFILFLVLSISGNLDMIRLNGRKKYLVLFSILQVVTMVTFFISILKASVSVAVLLLYSAPVYVTVFSPIILKERFSRTGLIALLISTAGMLLIVDPAKIEISGLSIGIIAGILSGVSYAFQIMTSKYISASYSGLTQAFWSFLIAVIILLPVGIAPIDVVHSNIVNLLLLAIFPTILAVSLYFNGLKNVRASSASILGLIEPVSAVILAVLILHEQITSFELAGGVLILAGAALVTKERANERNNS